MSKAGGLFGAVLGGGAVLGIKSAIDAASNLNESLSKSHAVFGRYSADVEAFAGDSRRNILLTKQAAIEGASTFGNLFTAMGVGQKPAAGLSTKLTALASDLSSFNNVDTEDALLSLRSGLLGEAEPLRKFGVQLSATRIEAEAMALGLVKPVKDRAKITAAQNAIEAASKRTAAAQQKYGVNSLQARQATDGVARAQGQLATAMKGQKVELTAAQKAQAAYSIIMKDTKTAQGDAARTSGGYANSTRILQKKLSDTRAEIGQKLLPAATRATTAFSELIDEFKAGTGTGGQLRDVAEDLGRNMKQAGGFARDYIVPPLRWLSEHPDALKGVVAGMAAYKTVVWGAAAGQKALATWMALTGQGDLPGGVGGTGGKAGKPGKVGKVGGKVAGVAGVGALIGGLAVEADRHLPDRLRAQKLPKLGEPFRDRKGKPYATQAEAEAANRKMIPMPKNVGPAANPRLDPNRHPDAPVRHVTVAPVIHMHGYNGSREDIKKIATGVMQELETAAARR